MKEKLMTEIEQMMLNSLDNCQRQELHRVLVYCLQKYSLEEKETHEEAEPNFSEMFLSAKRIEGCSEKSLTYYQNTIEKMVESIGKGIRHITTDDLRTYLADYQKTHNSSKVREAGDTKDSGGAGEHGLSQWGDFAGAV